MGGGSPPHGGAKLGTRFLGVGASFAALAIDVSQEGVNMTATATSITEQPAARYDQSHPRTLACIAEVSSTDAGTLFAQSNGAGGFVTRLRITAGGLLRAEVNGALVGSLQLSVKPTGQDAIIGWLSIANPDTTAAGDAVLSWLVVYHTDTGLSQRATFAHAVKTSTTARASWGDDDGAGVNAYSGRISMAGMHDRRMTLRELVHDWGPLGIPAAPASDFVEERMPPPIDLTVGIHDVDELHGPAAAWASHAHRMMRRRLASALHVRYPPIRRTGTATIFESDSHSTTPLNSKIRLAVGSSAYRWYLGMAHVWPVPAGCNEAWVELHYKQWTTSPGNLAPVGVRVYSCNRLPGPIGGLGGPPGDPYEQYFVEDLREQDDGVNGTGSHIALGRLPLAIAHEGIRKNKTYIVVAYAIDPENTSAFDADQQVQIQALHVVPGFREPANGGIGFGG